MGVFKSGRIISKGREYTVALSATYSVFVKRNDCWEAGEEQWYAEEEAWNIVEKMLKYCDPKECGVWGVIDSKPVDGGYSVDIKVNFSIFVVGFDPTRAYNEALDFVDNIKEPENVKTLLIEQADIIEVGEPVYMVVGE